MNDIEMEFQEMIRQTMRQLYNVTDFELDIGLEQIKTVPEYREALEKFALARNTPVRMH